MCGRFYIDDELKTELEQLLKEMNDRLALQKSSAKGFRSGEMAPTDQAVVLCENIKNAHLVKWGFPGWGSQKVIFNARSETVLQKPMFENGFVNHRCVIPVSGFYEWNKKKTKFYIRQKGERVMYLGITLETAKKEQEEYEQLHIFNTFDL